MTVVAAVDCGTNSVRLLVADIDGGQARDIARRMEIVRLGEGLDRTGVIAPAAIERTMAALRDFRADIDAAGAQRVRMVATSATRDARNRADFTGGVHAVLGVVPEVVTGADEAALSFAGATRELAGSDVPQPYLVVDIGGGSTEFVLGGDEMAGAVSVDIGCVRLTERHLREDPPTAGQLDAARRDIATALDTVQQRLDLNDIGTLVGLAGSVTTVAGIALDLPEYDAERLHHSRLTAAQTAEVSSRLLGMSHEERAAIPVMHPGRVDVIGAGALILHEIVDRLGVDEVLVSEHDILDGIAWSIA